ncbi:MAG: hypothetical protein KDB27_35230 [Planctomycetales bacterium]|nr:hypothetical protein [Planctomycetales bacterium]
MSTYANSNFNPGSVLKWIRNPPRSTNPNHPHPHPIIHQSVGELNENPLFAAKFLQAQSNDNKGESGIASSDKQKCKHGFFPSIDDASKWISDAFTNSVTQPSVNNELKSLDAGTNAVTFRVEFHSPPGDFILTERAGGQQSATAPGPAAVTKHSVKGIFFKLMKSADPDYPVLQTCFPYDTFNVPTGTLMGTI